MAPIKTNKQPEINPWGWTSQVRPENVQTVHLFSAYRITGFQRCTEPRRNCKRNPYCIWGLGEKKWKEDNEGEDDQEGAAFRCEGEYAGLQNLGATCYVNSLLQLWFHNPIFRPAILKWTPANDKSIQDGNYKPNCPLAQLQAIFARLKVSKRSKIDPTDFVSSLLLNTGEQQDAQEFAKLFMDFIVKLLTDYGDEQIRRLIAQSFNGQLQYETECQGCKNRTRRSEGFTELNLSVKKNLNESLDDLLADETISDEYMCSNCHKKNTAKRRMQLVTLPPILNLQLLRFVYDREAQRRKKVTQNISFPEVLEMKHRIFGINSEECDAALYKYHLTAVLIHNGQSASSGHYLAQIKDLRNGEWLKFNDEFVDPVSKNRSQKPKDEESGDEDEKKTKQKKSKNSPSLTSSGAYMLVYTLDQYIQKPEPDPDLHQYLVDLVKREDASFEEEVNKNKSEKDFEIAVRIQRRKEVEWLYELKKKASLDNGKADSDIENGEEPKPKIPRYDDSAMPMEVVETNGPENNSDSDVDKNCVLSTNGHTSENHKTSNGVGAEVSVLPKKNSDYQLDECDFVSADWITQWLDPGNPVPPVENAMLLCEHKKLAPPSPSSTPCLYRIIPSPLANVWYEHYQGGPRLKCHDLCEICVQSQCSKLRALAELDEDSKQVTELVKKFDSEAAALLKSGQDMPHTVRENKVWISKNSFKRWKKQAKRSIEGQDGSTNKGKDIEVIASSEECLDVDGSFNSDLFCEHGNLSPDANSRKIIPIDAWNVIAKYFDNPIALQVLEVQPCDDCRDQEQATTIALQQNKDVATKQRAGLSELYSNRNRPDVVKPGELYVVPAAFVSEWKRFVKEPGRHDIVQQLNNHRLMCEHDKFMYPITFVSEVLQHTDESDEMVCLLHPEEWKFIQENFQCDQQIKATIMNLEKKDNIHYEPDICRVCAEAWLEEAYKKQFEYADTYIYVVKREKGDAIDSDGEDDPKEKEHLVVSGKREVKKMDPDAWMTGFSSNNSIRRSQRPRTSKGEKSYKVSSSTTVKELKSKICPDFKALLSDQHLYYNNNELMDLTKTLADYHVPARSKIYLQVDIAENGSVEEPTSSVETGFQGTLLIGGNAFGDTRSPVQN